MSKTSWTKRTYAMCRRLAEQRGGSTLWYFADALRCGKRHGSSPENYFVLRFFALSDRERGEYLTSGRSKAADSRLNLRARPEELEVLGSKAAFARSFRALLKREMIFAPDCSRAEFEAFLERWDEFIIKPERGIQGRGVEKLRREDIPDREAFFARCRGEKLLLEQLIRQHPALNMVNPSCLNSVRLNLARTPAGEPRFIGACLKCGAPGAAADNFHSGGVAYPLELESGRVTGPGRNNSELRDFTRHPGSGCFMPGLQIPWWEETKALTLRAMEQVPSLGYVGWDVGIGPDGPELIEGNCRWPGGNIIQLDGRGKYPLILSCMGDRNEL